MLILVAGDERSYQCRMQVSNDGRIEGVEPFRRVNCSVVVAFEGVGRVS